MRDLATPSGYMPVANLGDELGLRVRPTNVWLELSCRER